MSRLHRAARLGNYVDVGDCLASGAAPDALSVHHHSALMLAAGNAHLAIVHLLLKAGATINLTCPQQRTALHSAAHGGHLEIVRALVAQGADINAQSRSGCTPALEAACFNHREVALFLQQQGTDPSLRDRAGRTVDGWLELGGMQGLFARQFPNGIDALPGVKDRSEKHVWRLMSEGLTAEEYAARHGRRILVWGYGHDHFSDPEVEKWAHGVAHVLFTPGLLDQYEEQFLAGEELEDARKCRRRRTQSAIRNAKRSAKKQH